MFRGGRLHITYEVPSSKLPILKTKFKDELQIDKYLGSYFYRVNTTSRRSTIRACARLSPWRSTSSFWSTR